jgi:putative AdoMet-dependent methyltransferase
MNSQFQPDKFDEWAAHYDSEVHEEKGFPFEGYSMVLQTIVHEADSTSGCRVLDLGIGSGNSALLFSNLGCEIWGLDFSAEMLAIAQKKLPKANLYRAYIQSDWPPLFERKFDLIVSAYTFHHFPLNEKFRLIRKLLKKNLEPGGKLIIGDIAFPNAKARDAMRQKMGGEWEEEYYWLADEVKVYFPRLNISIRFIQISSCAGVFIFQTRMGKTDNKINIDSNPFEKS